MLIYVDSIHKQPQLDRVAATILTSTVDSFIKQDLFEAVFLSPIVKKRVPSGEDWVALVTDLNHSNRAYHRVHRYGLAAMATNWHATHIARVDEPAHDGDYKLCNDILEVESKVFTYENRLYAPDALDFHIQQLDGRYQPVIELLGGYCILFADYWQAIPSSVKAKPVLYQTGSVVGIEAGNYRTVLQASLA